MTELRFREDKWFGEISIKVRTRCRCLKLGDGWWLLHITQTARQKHWCCFALPLTGTEGEGKQEKHQDGGGVLIFLPTLLTQKQHIGNSLAASTGTRTCAWAYTHTHKVRLYFKIYCRSQRPYVEVSINSMGLWKDSPLVKHFGCVTAAASQNMGGYTVIHRLGKASACGRHRADRMVSIIEVTWETWVF